MQTLKLRQKLNSAIKSLNKTIVKVIHYETLKTAVLLFSSSQFNVDSIQFNNSFNVAKFNYEQIRFSIKLKTMVSTFSSIQFKFCPLLIVSVPSN